MTKKEMTKKEKFNVYDHFSERESWTCDLCDEEIECSESKLKQHLKDKHNMEFEDDK